MASQLINVLVTTYSPFPTLNLRLPGHLEAASLSDILEPICPPAQQALSLQSGRCIPAGASLQSLQTAGGRDVHIRLAVRLPGGKGGFGSQLRAAGGRMNSRKHGQNNNDSCRDLNGRRLSTIKEAKKLADYLQAQPEREAAKIQEAKDRLAALHQEIAKLDGDIASTSAAAGGEASTSTAAATAAAGKKRRLDDQKYVEESREMVDNVKNAVAAAMLKKRKKASPPATSETKDAPTKSTPKTEEPSKAGDAVSASSAVTAAPTVAASA